MKEVFRCQASLDVVNVNAARCQSWGAQTWGIPVDKRQATTHPAWRNNAGVGWVDTGGVTVLVVFVTKVTLFGALAVTLL